MAENQLDNIALFKHFLSPSHLKPTERLVLLGIFKHRNNNSFLCFPGIDKIISSTGLSRATVHRTIQNLDENGEVIRVREQEGKRITRTFYFAVSDFKEALQIANQDDSVFCKVGDYDLLNVAAKKYQRALELSSPF